MKAQGEEAKKKYGSIQAKQTSQADNDVSRQKSVLTLEIDLIKLKY